MSIAYWCVFVGGLLPVLVVLIAKADPNLDVRNPRDVHLSQTGMRKRAYGAHLNGHEAFPFFAAAVVLATVRHVPPYWLDPFALGWVFIRLAYTAAYIFDFARIRPSLWALSVLVAAAIFFLPTA